MAPGNEATLAQLRRRPQEPREPLPPELTRRQVPSPFNLDQAVHAEPPLCAEGGRTGAFRGDVRTFEAHPGQCARRRVAVPGGGTIGQGINSGGGVEGHPDGPVDCDSEPLRRGPRNCGRSRRLDPDEALTAAKARVGRSSVGSVGGVPFHRSRSIEASVEAGTTFSSGAAHLRANQGHRRFHCEVNQQVGRVGQETCRGRTNVGERESSFGRRQRWQPWRQNERIR